MWILRLYRLTNKICSFKWCQNPAKLLEIDNNLLAGSSADFIFVEKDEESKELS